MSLHAGCGVKGDAHVKLSTRFGLCGGCMLDCSFRSFRGTARTRVGTTTCIQKSAI